MCPSRGSRTGHRATRWVRSWDRVREARDSSCDLANQVGKVVEAGAQLAVPY
jgi:hypothetical protein